MPPKSVTEALLSYQNFLNNEQPRKIAKEIYNQTLIAFIYYVLRAWSGPFSEDRKLTSHQIDAAYKFMEKISLLQMKDAVKVQAAVFQELQSTSYQKHRYGSSIKQFVYWLKAQDWWTYPDEPLPPKQYAPKYNHGHGSVASKNVSGRNLLAPYSLKPEKVPLILQEDLNEFYQYLIKSRYPGRLESSVRTQTANNYIIYIRRILGWFHLYARPVYDDQGIISSYSDDEKLPLFPLEKLSLELIVPKVKIKYASQKEVVLIELQQAVAHLDLWLCKFLDFIEIERKSKSWKSSYSLVGAVLALVRFHYYQETESSHYQDIPLMEKVREHLKLIGSLEKQHQRVSNIDMQWLDLPEVWQQIVKPLRFECAYRTSTGHLREIGAISHSFQLFLIWGFFTFRPPRRQREVRELKINLSCPIKRPANIKNGQFIHPLPVERNQDVEHGYLYSNR